MVALVEGAQVWVGPAVLGRQEEEEDDRLFEAALAQIMIWLQQELEEEEGQRIESSPQMAVVGAEAL